MTTIYIDKYDIRDFLEMSDISVTLKSADDIRGEEGEYLKFVDESQLEAAYAQGVINGQRKAYRAMTKRLQGKDSPKEAA